MTFDTQEIPKSKYPRSMFNRDSTTMPHHDKNTVDSDSPHNRPKTRPKNATTHPGIDAKKVLSTRRDPEIIEKEKLARQSKKEAKDRQKTEGATRKEAAQRHVENLRAQQAIELRTEESEVTRQPKIGTRLSQNI